jgi:hypothetical protein
MTQQDEQFEEPNHQSNLLHEGHTYDDIYMTITSPLAIELQATPWPPLYRPPKLQMYDGFLDPKQFLMSYKDTISSYGDKSTVIAKSFIMTIKNVARTWYSSL